MLNAVVSGKMPSFCVVWYCSLRGLKTFDDRLNFYIFYCVNAVFKVLLSCVMQPLGAALLNHQHSSNRCVYTCIGIWVMNQCGCFC